LSRYIDITQMKTTCGKGGTSYGDSNSTLRIVNSHTGISLENSVYTKYKLSTG